MQKEYLTNIRARYTGIIIAFGVAFVIWGVGSLGVFSIPEGILYDLFIRFSPAAAKTDSAVLLLEAPEEKRYKGDETWLVLLERLHVLGPRSVVFTFTPQNVSGQFFLRAKKMGNVFFGQELAGPVAENVESGNRSRISRQMTGEELPFGVVVIPPNEHGISRVQRFNFVVDGKDYPTLEAKVASYIMKEKALPEGHFMVNFIGKRKLPRISLELALSGGLIEELAREKNILIGFERSVSNAGINTPVSSGDNSSSFLEFQGNALNTLLLGKQLRSPGPLIRFVIIFAFALIMLVATNMLGIKGALRATVLLLLVVLVLCWSSLLIIRLWLPAFQLLLAQFLTSVLVLRKRTILSEQSANMMLLDMSVKLREYVLPETFYSSQEYWSQVITMVNQMLDLTRTIFLEKIENDHRVYEVKALNCSLADIHEKRRDYERTPYSTAISEGGPINLGTYIYLKKLDQPEEQYLVPLAFGGQTIGFWAFGIAPEKVSRIPAFLSVIKTFAYQISELLYRRQQWRRMKQEQEGILKGYASLSYDPQHYELRKSIELLGRRLLLLESVYSSMDLAVALFDVFGRMMLLNQRMIDTLKAAGLVPYEMTALDLASAISGEGHDRMRLKLSEVVLHHKTVLIPSIISLEDGREGVLNMKPLLCIPKANELQVVCPFDTYGLLFELYDKDKIEIPGLMIKGTVTEGGRTCCSADSIDIIREVSVLMQGRLDEKNIGLNIGHGTDVPAVVAEHDGLKEMIELIMVILARDATEGTELVITVRTGNKEVSYMFSDKGTGMPDEIFKQYFSGDHVSATPEFTRLRESIRHLEGWGGSIEASSKVGSGMRFIIRLKPADGTTIPGI